MCIRDSNSPEGKAAREALIAKIALKDPALAESMRAKDAVKTVDTPESNIRPVVSRSSRDAASISAANTSKVLELEKVLNKKEQIKSESDKESRQPIIINSCLLYTSRCV